MHYGFSDGYTVDAVFLNKFRYEWFCLAFILYGDYYPTVITRVEFYPFFGDFVGITQIQ